MSEEELEYQLEWLVDASNLERVMTALSLICVGKAEHLRTNWQDHTRARRWDKASVTLNRAKRQLPDLP